MIVDERPIEAAAFAHEEPALDLAPGARYVVFAGSIALIVFVITAFRYFQVHAAEGGFPLFTLQWFAVGIIGPLIVCADALLTRLARRPPAAALRQRFKAYRLWSTRISVAAYVALVLAIVSLEHTRYVLLVSAGELLILAAVWRIQSIGRSAAVWALLALAGMWAFACGISYTPLAELLLNASPADALVVPAFAASLALVAYEFAKRQNDPIADTVRSTPWWQYAIAGAIFLELALRTDGLLADWVPYHRMYFIAPAEFVRHGHYLLWDVPSQYGFLSILTLALIPTKSVWQGLYLLTALLLTAQALCVFALLRHGRRGYVNYVVSLLVPAAIFLSSVASRYPFGPRLYPQAGLRFFWPVALLMIAYFTYASRKDTRRARYWRAIGWIAWGGSVAWSFETGVWATCIWIPFVVCEAAIALFLERRGPLASAKLMLRRMYPLAAIPALLWLAVETFFFARLHHAPDWQGYVEFNLTYAADPTYHVQTHFFGSGWVLISVFAGVLSTALTLLYKRKIETLPLLAGCWFGVWGVAVYFVGEPYDNHVNLILGVVLVAFLILSNVCRQNGAFSDGRFVPGLWAIVPLLVICMTTSYGEPSRAAQMTMPFTRGYAFSPEQRLPAISGELARIIRRAGITERDEMILPNSPDWVKISNGLVMPFVRNPHGNTYEVYAWLPVSPSGAANTLYTLPPDRRQIYLDRFLNTTPHAGWLITYRRDADCGFYAANLKNASSPIKSTNYEAVRCELRSPRVLRARKAR